MWSSISAAADMPYRALFEARGARYVGCDIDPAAPVVITPGLPIALDDACASVVVSFQVLEHVWDLGWYLGECRRVLRPDGWLLLSTTARGFITRIRQTFGDGPRTVSSGEIEAHGFVVERITGLMGPLAWTTTVPVARLSRSAAPDPAPRCLGAAGAHYDDEPPHGDSKTPSRRRRSARTMPASTSSWPAPSPCDRPSGAMSSMSSTPAASGSLRRVG